MSPLEILALLSIVASGALSLVLVAYAWPHREVRSAKAFIAMMALSAWLSLTVLLRAVSATPTQAYTWFRLGIISASFAPVAWLFFALHYAEKQAWLTPETEALLLFIPVVTQLMVWTNPVHHLWALDPVDFVRDEVLWRPVTRGAQYRVWFWVHTLYSYGLMAVAGATMAKEALTRAKLYRAQAIEVLLGVALPVVGSILFVFQIFPNTEIPFMMLGLALGGWPLYRALFQHKLLEVVPIARDTLVERMEDGVLVIGRHNRVVDLNPAMAALLRMPPADAVGRPVAEVLNGQAGAPPNAAEDDVPAAGWRRGPWPGLLARLSTDTDRVEVGYTDPVDHQHRHFDVRITELDNAEGRSVGRQIVLRDISERRRAEMALRQANRDLQRRNEELDVFAMTAAHDLKDPLATIMGYASLLKSQESRSGGDAGGLNEAIPDIIWQTGMEMTNVINALSLLASVPRESIQLEPLDMPSLVASAEQRLVHLVAEYDADITHPTSWPSALGYGPWIGEVWINYLRNAIRGGEPPVSVEIGATDQDNGTVRYWVRQQRPGETPVEVLQDFTWMGQVGPRSHGLGNTIVRRIMERLGGEAGIQTREDGSVLYYFTLLKLED